MTRIRGVLTACQLIAAEPSAPPRYATNIAPDRSIMHRTQKLELTADQACSKVPIRCCQTSTSTFRRHLLSTSFGEPLSAVIKAGTGLFEAGAGGRITHTQVAGAAVDMVITADGHGQRATGPSEAVAKVLTHAAAGAFCSTARNISSWP